MNQAFQVNGRIFIISFPNPFDPHIHTCNLIEIITMVFTFTAYKKMFLFIYKVLPVIFSHFKIGDQLYGIGRAGLFAITAEYAP